MNNSKTKLIFLLGTLILSIVSCKKTDVVPTYNYINIDTIKIPPNTPLPSSYGYLVDNINELKDALSKVKSGQMVYIADDAKINMTGMNALTLKSGVILASGRGSVVGGETSLGGMLYTNDRKHIMINIGGENARISGIRLFGPDITPRVEETLAALAAGTFQSLPFSHGIRSNYNNFQVDNCELMGWTKAAISISNSYAYIHHNHIHHNQHYSLGYGVVLEGRASALIEYNSFHLNRHSVAGTGSVGQSYEVRFNTFYKNSYVSISQLDMHASGTNSDSTASGGKLINIHDNIFYHKGAVAIYLAGIPSENVFVVNNKFASPSQHSTIQLRSYTIRTIYSPNTFGIPEQSIDNVTLKTF